MRWFWLLSLFPCLSWATLLVNGPNCLNTVLVHQGMAQSYRYTSNVEMQVILESPLCRRIKLHQKTSQAIAVIRDEGRFAIPGIYSHAYIYLGAGMAFEKIGQSVSAGQRLGPERQILEDYEEGIRTRVEYYRCDEMKAWLQTLTPRQERLLSAMNRFEVELSRLMTSSLTAKVFTDLQSLSVRLRNYGKTLNDNSFLGRLLLSRLVSLSYQLASLGHGELRVHTRDFELDATRLPELPQVL